MSDRDTTNPTLPEIESEVIAWYKSYAQPWYDGNPNAEVSANYYAFPNYFAAPDGVMLVPDIEAHTSFFSGFISDLKSKGWTKTTLLNIDVKVINAGTVFIKTEVTNDAADGSPIEGSGVTVYSYLAAKTPEGWKFLSAHSS